MSAAHPPNRFFSPKVKVFPGYAKEPPRDRIDSCRKCRVGR